MDLVEICNLDSFTPDCGSSKHFTIRGEWYPRLRYPVSQPDHESKSLSSADPELAEKPGKPYMKKQYKSNVRMFFSKVMLLATHLPPVIQLSG